MIVHCEAELRFPASRSLKDKRNLLNSLKDKLQNKYNISVAEIDFCDFCKKSLLGLVSINRDFVHLEKVINNIVDYIDNFNGIQLVDYSIDYF